MAKKSSNNTLLLLGAVLGGAWLISKQNGGQNPLSTILNIFPSGESGNANGGIDLGGLLGGDNGGGLFGNGFDFGGLFDNFNNAWSNLFNAQNSAWQSAFSGLGGGGNGGGTTTPPTIPSGNGGGGYPPSMPNTIPNILNSLGFSAQSIGKGAIMLGGTYLGVKALSPVAPAIGQGIATGVRAVTPSLASGARTVVSGLGRAATGFAGYLGTPVTALGVTGTVAAIPLVAAAGYGGYKAGQWFNTTSAGKSLIEASGKAGASFSKTAVGQVFFPSAGVKQNAVSGDKFFNKWGITQAQAASMSTAQLQQVMQSKRTTIVGGAR